MILTYNWLHIESKKQGTSTYRSIHEVSQLAMADLLVFLNRCNSQNPGTWQYWF